MDKQQGFSLLELAVVVTIIGLIMGSTIVGQNMIRVAQINTIVDDVVRYSQAVTSFQDKFHALPGDFEAAESYWGTASGGCPSGARTGTQTCNGNGNGFIDWGPSGGVAIDTAANNYELFTAWQHLANAGLIEGKYSGLSGSGTGRNSVPGVNVPASRVFGAGYTMWTVAGYSDANSWTSVAPWYGTYIFFGTPDSGVRETDYPAITPREAFLIDSKMDDGLPGTGSVKTFPTTFLASCTSGTDASTAVYLSNTTIACSLIFKTGVSGP